MTTDRGEGNEMDDASRAAGLAVQHPAENDGVLTESVLDIVRFCSIECSLQMSGEASVAWMMNAWAYAMKCPSDALTESTVLRIGRLVEPTMNEGGYRKVGVRVGWNVKPHQAEVPDLMRRLIAAVPDAVAAGEQAEWYRQYEEVHPFRDGNGRSGQVLYNLLRGTLLDPEWAPDFWSDVRRVPGFGGPDQPSDIGSGQRAPDTTDGDAP